MKLTDLLSEDVIKVPIQARTKEDVIREMVTLLAEKGAVQNPEIVIQLVLERETMGSTGLDKGIAVPHSRTNEVAQVSLALGISGEGLDFNALDGEDSNLFFIILAPPDQSSQHIQILSQIAKISRNESLCTRLKQAASPAEVMNLLKEA